MNEYILLYNAETKDLILHMSGMFKKKVEWLMENGYEPVGKIESSMTRAEIKLAMESKLQAKCDKMDEGIQNAFKALHEAIN